MAQIVDIPGESLQGFAQNRVHLHHPHLQLVFMKTQMSLVEGFFALFPVGKKCGGCRAGGECAPAPARQLMDSGGYVQPSGSRRAAGCSAAPPDTGADRRLLRGDEEEEEEELEASSSSNFLSAFASLWSTTGPRCSASWPVWTRGDSYAVGWFCWCCTSRCFPSCCRQAPDAWHHGRSGPEGTFHALRFPQWHVQGSFCWCFTPRAVFLQWLSGSDALHHGRYGREGQLCGEMVVVTLS